MENKELMAKHTDTINKVLSRFKFLNIDADAHVINDDTVNLLEDQYYILMDDNVSCYVVGYYKLIRGVRYHKDGSGEPDEIEMIDLAMDGNINFLVDKAIKHYINNIIDNIWECITEAAMQENQEEM